MARRIASSAPLNSTSSSRSGRSPDVCVSRWRIGDAALAVPAELGDEQHHRIVEADAARARPASSRSSSSPRPWSARRGRRSCLRVIGSARRRDRAVAERAVIQDLVAAADQDDGAGQFVACDGGLDQRRDRRETGVVESGAGAGACAPGRAGEHDERNRASAAARVFTEDSIYTECSHYFSVMVRPKLDTTVRGVKAGFFRGIRMRHGLHLSRGVLAALFVAALASGAAAQTGRVGGTVKDEAGQPIKGATVTAENPERVAEQLHGDDRRQGTVLDHRPARPAAGPSPRRRRASRLNRAG